MEKLEQQLLGQVLRLVGNNERRIPNVVASLIKGAHIPERDKASLQTRLERSALVAFKKRQAGSK
jgi:hypothetical protein